MLLSCGSGSGAATYLITDDLRELAARNVNLKARAALL
jgi:hypothetical protein